jgi:alcohol dehydrogenase
VPTDAIVRVTSTSICRSDLKILHGKYRGPGYPHKPGLILGHEGVGIVEKVGSMVKKVKPGDRVVIANNSQCGTCFYCLKGVYSSCENAGYLFGNIINGTQAEFVRVPYADMGLYPFPEWLQDESVLCVSDIASTAFFGVEKGGVRPGDVVAVFGAGPIGQSIIAITKLFGAGLIIAVDLMDSRLEVAKKSGADITINSQKEARIARGAVK